MIIEKDVPLASFTTFGIGGPARFFIRAESDTQLLEALEFAKEKSLRIFVLGGGSNVLIADAGFDGLVLKIEIKGIEKQTGEAEGKQAEEKEKNSEVVLIAGAGESWDGLVKKSVAENLWGLENLSGIPGSVGGAVAGNIGAYGAALSQALRWVEVFDTKAMCAKKMTGEECVFGYRDSFFKRDGGRVVILRAAFALSSAPKPELSYKDLAERFVSRAAGASPSLRAIRDAVLAIRKGKFPDAAAEGTAGSFFKNPILGKAEALELKERYPEMPLFGMPETAGTKIPLAWLLDAVLGMRGYALGGARLFERQPLVIVAKKNTPARDVRALADAVSKKVFEEFHIEIEPEVRIIG